MKIKNSTYLYFLFTIVAFLWLIQLDYRVAFSYWYFLNPTPDRFKSISISKIKKNKLLIKKISKEFKINPLLISGIIYTENSLNPSPTNQIEDYYIKKVILRKSEIEINDLINLTKNNSDKKDKKGKRIIDKLNNKLSWSLGLCQMSILRAIEIEKQLANFDKRKVRSNKQIISSLLIDSENLRYCAFEIRLIQNAYLNNVGLDLSNNPEIILSAYNLGNIDKLLKLYTVNKSREPKPNFFGSYFLMNIDEIQSTLN